jgi:hypothetical protein
MRYPEFPTYGMSIMPTIPQLPVFSIKNGVPHPWDAVYTNARQKEMMGWYSGMSKLIDIEDVT